MNDKTRAKDKPSAADRLGALREQLARLGQHKQKLQADSRNVDKADPIGSVRRLKDSAGELAALQLVEAELNTQLSQAQAEAQAEAQAQEDAEQVALREDLWRREAEAFAGMVRAFEPMQQAIMRLNEVHSQLVFRHWLCKLPSGAGIYQDIAGLMQHWQYLPGVRAALNMPALPTAQELRIQEARNSIERLKEFRETLKQNKDTNAQAGTDRMLEQVKGWLKRAELDLAVAEGRAQYPEPMSAAAYEQLSDLQKLDLAESMRP